MKRLLALVPAVLLAACGGDTCNSNPATVDTSGGVKSCSLSPGATATVTVTLCAKCSDSQPSCVAEFLPANNPNHLEVAPTVQQCQENAACAQTGCNINAHSATCTVNVPPTLAGGSYTINIVGDTLVNGTLTVGASGGSSCVL
jgi:hypothetical protein